MHVTGVTLDLLLLTSPRRHGVTGVTHNPVLGCGRFDEGQRGAVYGKDTRSVGVPGGRKFYDANKKTLSLST